MNDKNQRLKTFAIQVSGLATFCVYASNEKEALERFSNKPDTDIFESMELEYDVVEGHG